MGRYEEAAKKRAIISLRQGRELVRLRRGRGTSACCYRCSVPGLAEFAAARLHGVRSLITQCRRRRGWDSNPRYSFPYTAFPVLPVQPLLHLSRLRVVDFGLTPASFEPHDRRTPIRNLQSYGGAGGIRTHGTRRGTTAFE